MSCSNTALQLGRSTAAVLAENVPEEEEIKEDVKEGECQDVAKYLGKQLGVDDIEISAVDLDGPAATGGNGHGHEGGGHGRGMGGHGGGRGAGSRGRTPPKSQEAVKQKDAESKEGKEVKLPDVVGKGNKDMTHEELLAWVRNMDGHVRRLEQDVARLQQNEKTALKQTQELTRENTALKQDLMTKTEEIKQINARVQRVETAPDVKALAAQVSAEAAPQLSMRGPGPKETFVLLITGMPEAKGWKMDDHGQIMQVLKEFKCANGITRAERLGRRVREHRGGGRFVLVECTEECAHSIRDAAVEMNKKGIAVRPAKQGFRQARKAALPSLRPPGLDAVASAPPLRPAHMQPPAQAHHPAQLVPVCRQFQRGECTYGRQCRYQHVLVCFDYAGGQRCRFANQSGRGCKFAHVRWDGTGDDQGWNDAAAWRRDDRGRHAGVGMALWPSGHGRH